MRHLWGAQSRAQREPRGWGPSALNGAGSVAEPTRERLLSLIDAFSRVKVLAVVDLVADEYIVGQISRVSREAPVLILDYDESRIVPGGGANAVNNIAALGGRALAVGTVGDDADGARAPFAAPRIEGRRLGRRDRFAAYSTPTKTRILAGGPHSAKQQVVRIDRKARVPETRELRRRLAAAVKDRLPEAGAVMVSDYDYGLVTKEIGKLARAARRLASKARRPRLAPIHL